MISVDTAEDNKAFAEKEHADFPILSDPGKTVANAYGVINPPSAAQPNPPQFAQRWTFYIGPDGRILDIDKSKGTQTQTAGDTMIAKLRALGVKEKK
jgi:peroxiredoxin Q/BCP